jgi:hypothetical protein
MYSAQGSVEIVVEDAAGREIDPVFSDHIAAMARPDLDWTQRLPERLCEVPGAVTVTVRQSERSRTVTC